MAAPPSVAFPGSRAATRHRSAPTLCGIAGCWSGTASTGTLFEAVTAQLRAKTVTVKAGTLVRRRISPVYTHRALVSFSCRQILRRRHQHKRRRLAGWS